jgi:hypothetical protein
MKGTPITAVTRRLSRKVTSDFVEERQAPEHAIHNYADWLLASFGNGIGGERIEYLQGMNWR